MISQSKLIERLRHNILFENLSDEEFGNVKDKLTEARFKANQVILEDEGVGEKLYLLVEGRVKVVKKINHSDETLLALLHHGDCFGELELIDGRHRTSKVVAVEDCVAYMLLKADFDHLKKEYPPFAQRLLQLLSVRLRALNYNFVQELIRNSERTATELSKLHQLIEAAKIVNSTLELDKLLTVILETALHVVDADRGTLYLIDYTKQELWSKVLKGTQLVEIRFPIGKGIAGYVAATGDTLVTEDAYLDHRFNPEFDERTGFRTKTMLCMPMRNKEQKIIGVFQLLNKLNGLFTVDDQNFIDALSVHSSIAIENARLYDQEREKIKMEKELLAAREVQVSLLPNSAPHVEGYDLAGTSLPAQFIGGDYFDFIPLDKSKTIFCLGDVSGKGLPAALLMAKLQATLRAETLSKGSPKDWIRRANKLLHQNTTPEKFMTLFFGLLDKEHHTICYCNAGHDAPYFISQQGEIQRLKTGGLVLSVLNDYPYEEETFSLRPGEVLIVTSDGVIDAINPEQQRLGENKLIEILLSHRNGTAREILDAVLNAVKKHTRDVAQFDDITIVVLKRLQDKKKS